MDTMPAVGLDDATSLNFGMAFDNLANIPEEHSRLDDLDCTFETFPGGFRNANRVYVCSCSIPDVVGLVEITMKPAMIERHVDIDDISI